MKRPTHLCIATFVSCVLAIGLLTPRATFAQGPSRNIVYLVDASGSMMGTLPFVIMELKRSINGLSSQQRFKVIFFQGEKVIEVPPKGLAPGTRENKFTAMKWIDSSSGNIIPAGDDNLLPGLKLALSYQPYVLYILSDNYMKANQTAADKDALIKKVRMLDRGKSKINTISFLYPDPTASDTSPPVFKQIADWGGGIHKFADAEKLGMRASNPKLAHPVWVRLAE